MKKASIKGTRKFLQFLKEDLEYNDVSNLTHYCSAFGVDHVVATVLRATEIVKKEGKFYQWNDNEPNKKMARLVRETANEYKNYAI